MYVANFHANQTKMISKMQNNSSAINVLYIYYYLCFIFNVHRIKMYLYFIYIKYYYRKKYFYIYYL